MKKLWNLGSLHFNDKKIYLITIFTILLLLGVVYSNQVINNYFTDNWNIKMMGLDIKNLLDSTMDCDNKGFPHIILSNYQRTFNEELNDEFRHYNEKVGLRYYLYTENGWIINDQISITNAIRQFLLLDSKDIPHIIYLDYIQKQWKYTQWKKNDFQIIINDYNYSKYYNVNMCLDFQDNPYIYYIEESGNEFNRSLALIIHKWTGTEWLISNYTNLFSNPLRFRDESKILGMKIDRNGDIHLFFLDKYILKYAKINSNNICIIHSIEDYSEYYASPLTTNMFVYFIYHSSMILDNNNIPYLCYFDSTFTGLKFAQWNGYKWNIHFVENAFNYYSYPSLMVDKYNNIHLSYFQQAISGDPEYIKYAKWDGFKWKNEIVGKKDYPNFLDYNIIDINNKKNIYFTITTIIDYYWVNTSVLVATSD